MIKIVCAYITSNNLGLHHPSFNFLVFAKMFGSPQRPIAQDEFETEFEKMYYLRQDEKSQRKKLSRYCPFNSHWCDHIWVTLL
jgi:hypothetical protein